MPLYVRGNQQEPWREAANWTSSINFHKSSIKSYLVNPINWISEISLERSASVVVYTLFVHFMFVFGQVEYLIGVLFTLLYILHKTMSILL